MLTKLNERARSEKGFTLIELLVVILIIGILAAIAIPAFIGQRARGQDTAAKTAVREASTAMETYATDLGGKYTGADAPKLKAIEESLNSSPGSSLAVSNVGDATYTVTVTSANGNTFSITKNAGATTRACSTAGGTTKGGCPGTSW